MATTVAQALAWARAQGLARLDAQLLLALAVQQERSWLIAHDDAPLSDAQQQAFDGTARRRARGEPLAYLSGEREFRGLNLRITPAVLVPRPETEMLVDWALERLAALTEVGTPEVVDLGTGSGAIAIALRHANVQACLTATDLSPAALEVARANSQRLGTPLRLRAGSWWHAVAGERFHLAVSNPPYIAGDDPHLAALTHEPRQALTPEGDGLAALHTLIDGAAPHLQANAWLLLEHGHDQADAVQRRLRERGFTDIETRNDLSALPRCTGARWPGQPNIGASR